MYTINLADMRRNVRDIVERVAQAKEPAVILQRSRPVAYLVDPETFEKSFASTGEARLRSKVRQKSLDSILRLRSEIARRTGIRDDSTALVRKLREGQGRYE